MKRIACRLLSTDRNPEVNFEAEPGWVVRDPIIRNKVPRRIDITQDNQK
jgi:hypothetical protein